MEREYLNLNVYEAIQKRFSYIFQEFDNIYVSFSGGKDSGLLLNLLMDYKHKHGITKTLAYFIRTSRHNISCTTKYVEEMFDRYMDEIDPYWVCLPMAVRTALSSYELFWYPWDDQKQDIWVRPMP